MGGKDGVAAFVWQMAACSDLCVWHKQPANGRQAMTNETTVREMKFSHVKK